MLKKYISLILAITVTFWLPISLLLNPGWGSLLLVSPYALFFLLPLLVPNSNRLYSKKMLPKLDSWLQIAFYVAWTSIGFFYVNGGDTPESVQSIFTRLIGATYDNQQALVDLSGFLYVIAFWLALALLMVILFFGSVARDLKMTNSGKW